MVMLWLSLVLSNSGFRFDGDKNVEMSHIDEVKTAISKMGFSPDLFTYHVLSPEDFNYEIDI